MPVLSKSIREDCGCDGRFGIRGLIGIDEALSRISTTTSPIGERERLPLHLATGRTLASQVVARACMPRFDHSAMDGYALNSSDLRGAGPWVLPVSRRVAAGDSAPRRLQRGTAARIFTGAPIPAGADCVVMQEAVHRKGDGVLLQISPKAGNNIRKAGEEHEPGDEILPQGTILTPRAVAASAAAGVGMLDVVRQIRVALLVSGAELVAPGVDAPGGGQIWDVNTPLMQAVLGRPGVQLVRVDSIPDDLEATSHALARAGQEADLVVTTGGVSVGEEDHLLTAFAATGGDIGFSGVAIKPGKPVSFGTLGEAKWLGLPGNPQSAFVTWVVFGEQILNRLGRKAMESNSRRNVVLGQNLTRKPGRCELRPAILTGKDGWGREIITCLTKVNSGQVTDLARSDGLAFLPAEADHLPEGAMVEFLPFCER